MGVEHLSVRPQSTDQGYVYVAQRGDAYKIGFSRRSVRRRVLECDARLVLTIRTGQQPSVLEYLINHRFTDKRLPPQGTKPGDQREWFALDASDLEWLRGLSLYLEHNILRIPVDETRVSKNL